MSNPSFDAVVEANEATGRRYADHRVCLDPKITHEYAELLTELGEVLARRESARRAKARDPESRTTATRLNGSERAATEVAKKIEALIEGNPTAFYEIRLEALGRPEWWALRSKFPPRDNNDDDRGLYNAEAMTEPAVVASMVDPEPTEKNVEFLRSKLHNGDWEQMMRVVWSLNEGLDDVPKAGVASAILSGSGIS